LPGDRLKPQDIIIVGAGAAGLAAAIFTRRFAPSSRVLLLDGARKPGAKILISGGSRCNVTNRRVNEHDFWGGRSSQVRRVLRAFRAEDTVAFFRELGVALHEEAGGKLFPDSNRSRDVLDALMRAIASAGVTLLADQRVADVSPTPEGFRVTTPRGAFDAPAVVLATGGRSLPKTGSDGGGYDMARRLGHTIIDTTPALVPLVIDGQGAVSDHAGVSQDVELALWIDGSVALRLAGALLWTHFGVSGPVIMNMSRHMLRAQAEGRHTALTVNFCAAATFDQVDARLQRATGESPRATVQTWLSRTVPASVAAAMLSRLAIDSKVPLAHLTREDRRRLAGALVAWPLPVTGTRGYNYAEATAGGVSLDEVDSRTMESRICPGLFLVGEVLDVDGRIGGFNFQWAWSSAFVAGRALAGQLVACPR
jgi:predicted Rossmann fold flavoprotein